MARATTRGTWSAYSSAGAARTPWNGSPDGLESTLGQEGRGAREALVVCHPVLVEPGLRDALLRPGQPRFDHRVFQLVSVELVEIRDADEHRGVAVPMRRREEDPAVVGEHEFLDSDVGDAEDQHVVESFARIWIDRVSTAAAMEAEELAVHEIGWPAVVGHFLRRLRHREGELVEV